MSINSETRRQFDSLIRTSRSVLVLVPKEPSNDAVGAAIALIQILQLWGKRAFGFSSSLLPKVQYLFEKQYFISNLDDYRDLRIIIPTKDNQNLQVINATNQTEDRQFNIIVRSSGQGIDKDGLQTKLDQYNFDLIITVGISGVDKFDGEIADNPTMLDGHNLINLDFHTSNSNFGSLNIIDQQQISTCQLIYELFKPYGANLLMGDIATALLSGLMANTNRFISPNTNSEIFRQAAHLIDLGARNIDIGYCLFGDTDKFIANQAKKTLNEPQEKMVEKVEQVSPDPTQPISAIQENALSDVGLPMPNNSTPAPIYAQDSHPIVKQFNNSSYQNPPLIPRTTPPPPSINFPATDNSNQVLYQNSGNIPDTDRPIPPKNPVPDWQKLSSIINNKYQDNPLNKLDNMQQPKNSNQTASKKSLAEELMEIDVQNNPLIY